jgi:5-methylcytosine-specific restriction endonuclease McrA
MRHIPQRPSGEVFQDWKARAGFARDRLVEQWTTERDGSRGEDAPFTWKPRFKEELYKELRQVFLFEAFGYKCAYCEANHSDGYPVQVEHYRPKGGVTQFGTRVDHPGYFWLAYEWWNLVPACANCNSPHRDPLTGLAHSGKKNDFPIGGTRVETPSADPEQWQDELIAEQPLLLNPYFDKPEDHVDFDESGVPFAKTPRGQATIKTCDLDRISLCERRLNLRNDVLHGMVFRLENNENLDTIVPPTAEFSLWRKRLLRNRLTEMCARLGLVVRFEEANDSTGVVSPTTGDA